jgi:hypothetical protein
MYMERNVECLEGIRLFLLGEVIVVSGLSEIRKVTNDNSYQLPANNVSNGVPPGTGKERRN